MIEINKERGYVSYKMTLLITIDISKNTFEIWVGYVDGVHMYSNRAGVSGNFPKLLYVVRLRGSLSKNDIRILDTTTENF